MLKIRTEKFTAEALLSAISLRVTANRTDFKRIPADENRVVGSSGYRKSEEEATKICAKKEKFSQ
jgi:hypothetical protein